MSALARACHPAPTVAVTAIGTVLFVSAGCTAAGCVVGALAVLAGQLSIGWSNDLIDRRRDTAAGRSDKPAATGELSPRALRLAIAGALAGTLPLSLALGWPAAALHLALVAAGWLYNARLKSTAWSPLPYLLAFGSLPAIATQAAPQRHWPPLWVVAAAGVIGVGAHFGNVLPDLAADLGTGVRGLPHRLRPAATAATACALTVLTSLLGLGFLASRPAAAGLAVVSVVAAFALHAARGRPEIAFEAIMLCAAVNVAVIAASGTLGR